MAFGFWVTPAAGKPGEIHTTALNRVGEEAVSNEGYRYIYLKGVANTVLGSPAVYDEAGETVLLDGNGTATLVGPVAFASAATVANTFGWYGIVGAFPAVAATVADNARVFATDTAGTMDDAEVDDYQLVGAIWRSADSGGLATVQANRPWAGMAVDASA